MGDLSDLTLKYAYHKGEDDISHEFYIPCMERATTYDRAVGFFSSSIYALCWDSLKGFIERKGKFRFICSPVLSKDDINAISEGYSAQHEQQIAENLKKEFDDLMDDAYLSKPTRVVASLVALGFIEFKIAFIGSEASIKHRKLFHDKLGIFGDGLNSVVFKGSMNETWSGLSLDGNLESVDVFVSWADDREKERIEDEQNYFEKLWNNSFPNAEVVSFPSVAKEHLVDISDVSELPSLLDEISEDIKFAETFSADRGVGARKPRPHQISALKNWLNNHRKGIFEHATGSGKTFTGLCAIRDALQRNETPLVLVPSKLLLRQWEEEIKSSLIDLKPSVLLCGDVHTKWRTNKLLGIWSSPSNKNRIIISTMQTASSDIFLKLIREGQHLFILGDEVHRLGSLRNRKIFEMDSGARLGLSATPRRSGDPEGTSAILNYFGGIIPPSFLMKDAIKAKVLTPYMYYVHTVTLNESEQEKWDEFTKKIKRLYGQNRENPDHKVGSWITNLLIQRSRIAKSAKGKVQVASDILEKYHENGQRWIVYCDTQDQIHKVMSALAAKGIPSIEYHSQMEGDREQTLKYFESVGGIVVSIRCLDEGVDIPSVTHALILASSRNPREFIQRRGRVLRKADKKPLAYIHDVLVIPSQIDNGEDPDTAILNGELIRAIEFGGYAANPSSVTDLKLLALQFKLDYECLREVGVEEDNE